MKFLKATLFFAFVATGWPVGIVAPRGAAMLSDSPDGWRGVAVRDEIKPDFTFSPKGGPARTGSLVISADRREGLDGHWETTIPVKGGQWYRFRAVRRVDNVPVPRRSVLARVHWRDDSGRRVFHDEPGAHSYAPGKPPVSEPEYPNDGPTERHRLDRSHRDLSCAFESHAGDRGTAPALGFAREGRME